jgi:hypothetical protein
VGTAGDFIVDRKGNGSSLASFRTSKDGCRNNLRAVELKKVLKRCGGNSSRSPFRRNEIL